MLTLLDSAVKIGTNSMKKKKAIFDFFEFHIVFKIQSHTRTVLNSMLICFISQPKVNDKSFI